MDLSRCVRSESTFKLCSLGKDQCDRDSATAKRQMNYYIEEGHNIESAIDMNKALCAATALCGFKSNVLEISQGPKHKSLNVINKTAKRAIVSKVHNIVYHDGDKKRFQVWLYEGIGPGKFCPAGDLPSSNNAKVIVPFSNVPCGVGTVSSNKQGTDEKIYCTKPMCVPMFKNMKALEKHLDTGKCKMEITRPTQLSE